MSVVKDEITDQVVHLDYAEYHDTLFRRCKLVYEGGRPPTLVGCVLDECEFIFDGPALNTVRFLKLLSEGGEGGAELVIKTFMGLNDWSKNG